MHHSQVRLRHWGAPVSANILPVGDADFYRIAALGCASLRVRFTSAPKALDMAFRVLEEAGAQVWHWQTAPKPGAAYEAEVELDAGGTYYLEVRDGHNNARAAQP